MAAGMASARVGLSDQEWLGFWHGAISGFKNPSYTYVIRIDIKDWRVHERAIMGIYQKDLPSMLDEMVDGEKELLLTDVNYDWEASLAMKLQNHHSLGQTLCESADIAVKRLFQLKQQNVNPVFSCFTQAEIGEDSMHVHVVCGGDGLTKFNAKKSSFIIAKYFWNTMYELWRHYEGCFEPSNAQYAVSVQLRTLCEKVKAHQDETVTCLTYRDRHNESHAQRIDAPSYITNYLLPKNRMLTTWLGVEVCTPSVARFDTNKTYMCSHIDRQPISHYLRKGLHDRLVMNSSEDTGEPVHKMARWGDLPQVSENSLARQNTQTRPTKINKKQHLMLDTLQRCEEQFICTKEELTMLHPDIVIMFESTPSGSRTLDEILEMHRVRVTRSYSALGYILKQFPESRFMRPENKVVRLLNIQGYNAIQAGHWVATVLDKKAGKQNTLCFFGPASTGKTNLAKAIAQAVKVYGCVNHLNKSFVFNDCQNKLLCWWEECVMHNDWVEPAKCLMGGTSFRVDRKHKDSAEQPHTPLIISTNHDIYTVVGGNTVSTVHEKPIRDRTVQFNFMKTLPQNFGEISVQDVAEWLGWCAGDFDCTLDGFKKEWDIEHVPNSFPLAVYCDGHLQDFVLYAQGPCCRCGGYLPHTTTSDGDWSEPASGKTLCLRMGTPSGEGRDRLMILFLSYRACSCSVYSC
uniref:Initiator protein NS1 n=1 Tax=Porcine bocavirus 3 TaxID=1084715 RepID=A0A513PZG3_9VIRU|nr:MAG: NS1 [Porcine bocavirus 3]QBA84402.1 MAG: NS1 [Porcine bocavirus 3]QBA84405.1 MAG: NS1 [Porcine bocavirus 3]QBA84408.1 MAG: NS1 [Porcine bocavirus 3]QBA84411.1 MAG: NS1 [Porcine bocavirus 3]